MYAQRDGTDSGELHAWYNNWGDLWGDVKSGAQWLTRTGQSAQNAGQQANNAANNAANLTSWRVDVSTVALGLGLAAVVYAMTRPRR